jgi:hypothetical protein
MAKLVLANVTAEMGGNTNQDWIPATRYYLNWKALQRQFNLGDYTSPQCVAIYDCLNVLLGYNVAQNVIDPNYQPNNTPIVVTNAGAIGYVTSPNIVFSGTGPFTISLSNWQTVWAPEYGQFPTLEIYTNQGGIDQRDYQTEPTYIYATPGDPTTPLQSISWGYPVDTVGYYRITGSIPTSGSSGGSGGGGNSSTFLIYSTNPNIFYDGGDNFVYTNPTRLAGKSGYWVYVPQNGQYLFDGIGIQSNAAAGSFTMLGNPGFVLDPNYPLIVNLN